MIGFIAKHCSFGPDGAAWLRDESGHSLVFTIPGALFNGSAQLIYIIAFFHIVIN